MAGGLEIGAVARELGVAPSTLRSWERRYNVVVPQRGEHGQRIYTEEQIAALRRVLHHLARGLRARHAHLRAADSSPIRSSVVRLEPTPQAPRLARRAVDQLLDDSDDTRFGFSLRLVASELVTNAVLHGSKCDPIRMEAKLYRDGAELRVQNDGPRLTLRSLRVRRRYGGRGLDVVDALADSWSIESHPRGTRISVHLPVERPASRTRARRDGAGTHHDVT